MSNFIIVSSLPNTSAEVSGVKFQPGAGGRYFSEPVAEELAERFKAIDGFTVVAATKAKPAAADGDQGGAGQAGEGADADQGAATKGKAKAKA